MPSVRWPELWAALKETWPLWLGIGGIATSLAAGWFLGWFLSTPLASTLRYTGTTLQLLGIGTVAYGLHKMRHLFRRPSLGAGIVDWLRQVTAAFTRPRSITLKAEAGSYVTAGGDLHVEHGVAPDASLERRVSMLEEKVRHLRDDLDAKLHEVRQELANVKGALTRESQTRQEETLRTARMIEEVAVGGLHLERIGLVWLFLGVVIAGAADEIAHAVSFVH